MNKSSGWALSGWGDSNSRPLRPERSALTGLRHTPVKLSIVVCQLSNYNLFKNVNRQSLF